jgi:hypothetical protein
MSQDGIYGHTFEYEKDPECLVCSQAPKEIRIKPDTKVSKFSEAVVEQLYVIWPWRLPTACAWLREI